jgi:hypothetical protein
MLLDTEYTKAISRMKLRRKSAPDTLKPLFKELQIVIQLAVPILTTQEGRALISSFTILCRKIANWAETVAGGEHEDTRLSKVGSSPTLGLRPMTVYKSKAILKGLLIQVIISCGHCICASIAQRTFELCYPRLVIRSSQKSGWEEGEEVILDAIVSHAILLLKFLV